MPASNDPNAAPSIVICDSESDVGGDHTNQRHTWKVVALGNHLGADEHIEFTSCKSRKNRRQCPLAADGITIEQVLAATEAELVVPHELVGTSGAKISPESVSVSSMGESV